MTSEADAVPPRGAGIRRQPPPVQHEPGIGIAPIADRRAHQRIVNVVLAAKSIDTPARNNRSACRVEVLPGTIHIPDIIKVASCRRPYRPCRGTAADTNSVSAVDAGMGVTSVTGFRRRFPQVGNYT